MRFTYTCEVRWGDMDAMGHVNNMVVSDFFQEARIALLRHHREGSPDSGLHRATLVASQQVSYLRQLHFDGTPVSVDLWIAEFRAASYTLAYEVYRGEGDARSVYATGQTVLTPVDLETGMPQRLDPAVKAELTPALDPTEVIKSTYHPFPLTELGHYPIKVRFSDLDVYRHVNNTIYFEYLQEARIVHWRNVTHAVRPGENPKWAMVVGSQSIEYKRPMVQRDEPYDCWIGVTSIGRSSLIQEGIIRDTDGTVMARSSHAMVLIDTSTGKSVPLPDDLRAFLEEQNS